MGEERRERNPPPGGQAGKGTPQCGPLKREGPGPEDTAQRPLPVQGIEGDALSEGNMVIPPPGGKARKPSLPEPHPQRQGSLTARRRGTLSSSSSSSSIPQAAGWTIPEAAELGTDSSISQTAGWRFPASWRSRNTSAMWRGRLRERARPGGRTLRRGEAVQPVEKGGPDSSALTPAPCVRQSPLRTDGRPPCRSNPARAECLRQGGGASLHAGVFFISICLLKRYLYVS